MDLKSICQDKAKFSQEVKQNAEQDMKELGIRILSFNVQNVNDKDGLIDDLGIEIAKQSVRPHGLQRRMQTGM